MPHVLELPTGPHPKMQRGMGNPENGLSYQHTVTMENLVHTREVLVTILDTRTARIIAILVASCVAAARICISDSVYLTKDIKCVGATSTASTWKPTVGTQEAVVEVAVVAVEAVEEAEAEVLRGLIAQRDAEEIPTTRIDRETERTNAHTEPILRGRNTNVILDRGLGHVPGQDREAGGAVRGRDHVHTHRTGETMTQTLSRPSISSQNI